MSLILKALEKAKSVGGRKPAPPPHPAALASFRFGRPRKAQRIRKILLVATLPIIIVGAGTGYGIRYWLKKSSRPAAVVVNAPPNFEISAPAAQAAPTLEPAEQNVIPAAPIAAPVAGADAAAAPKPPRPRRVVERFVTPKPVEAAAPIENDVYGAPNAPTVAAAPPAAAVPAAGTAVSPAPISHNGFELAVFYQRSGEYTKALEQYQKLLERDPLNASVYLNLGLLHQAMSNNFEATKAFRQAILIKPNYDKAHNDLGIALMNSGQDAEAEREFNRALQINPKSTEAITNLALIAQKLGNKDQAKTQLLRVIQMSPKNAEAHYNLASLYEEEGEVNRAVEHYRKFLDEGSSSYPDLARDVERKIQELSNRKEQFRSGSF